MELHDQAAKERVIVIVAGVLSSKHSRLACPGSAERFGVSQVKDCRSWQPAIAGYPIHELPKCNPLVDQSATDTIGLVTFCSPLRSSPASETIAATP